MAFNLHISIENPQLDLVVHSGHHWLIEGNADDNSFSLFDWLEDRKFLTGGKIEFVNKDISVEGQFAVKKFIEILRFRIKENESESFYYQQRYHATENEEVVKLKDFLGENIPTSLSGVLKEFGLSELLDETINMLSSGEFRKACILKAFASKPSIIFIEDPYSGIDQDGKTKIDNLLQHLADEGTSIVINSNNKHKPGFITDFLNIDNKPAMTGNIGINFRIPENCDTEYKYTFEFINATIKYGEKTILNNLNWKVEKGEKWCLSGINGAGKSTLLSMLYADNPQVYSNDVFIFGNKRGTGETIWEVKDRITYFSSEMFRYFNKTYTISEAIDYLIFQNPYKKRYISKEQIDFTDNLLNYYGFYKREMPLNNLWAVQQRLILLIGGLVKNTPLLILDEPFNGFDYTLLRKTVELIEKYTESRTIIMVTHNPEELPKNVNRRYHLKNGCGKEIEL